LLGEEGWGSEHDGKVVQARGTTRTQAADPSLVDALGASARPFRSIESVDLDPLLARMGDARLVLIGEATHGTSEFYEMRERISRALITDKNFSFVAIEGDWPDAARIDHYVRHSEIPASEWTAFARFPQWMWRNNEVRTFVDWLRGYNAGHESARRVAFYGLDLYSLYNSIQRVLDYLDDVDPAAAKVARERYGCLTPWQTDPATYGRAAITGDYRSCENDVAVMLAGILAQRREYALRDGERYLDAVQNARLIANAERYYRIMYYGSRESWNLRDTHMFETLNMLLNFHGPNSKAIVWAHNSHVGDAAATEMSIRGEFNLGELCRREFGDRAYLIGFGTNSGTVAAASGWDEPMEVKFVQPAMTKSYEYQCHSVSQETGDRHFMLPLGANLTHRLREQLETPRLERAIGVIYRPETELASHYFQAVLPRQFDEYIWFDETRAVTPFATGDLEGLPDTYPFGL
jgi:protein-L-isoaspartate(D-aspartate) O-methyltransferase